MVLGPVLFRIYFSLESLNVTCPVGDYYGPSLILITCASQSPQQHQTFRTGGSSIILYHSQCQILPLHALGTSPQLHSRDGLLIVLFLAI